MPGILDFLTGTPERTQQFQNFTPQQQNLQNQSIGQALSLLQNPGSNLSGFQPIEQQARTNFEQKTIPGLAERFSALNGQRSSAFQGALGSAASEFEQGLGALKSQYGLQSQGLQNQLLNQLLGYGLKPSFENVHFQRQPGFLENLGGGVAQGAASILPLLGLLLGGPAGGALGTAAGAGLSAFVPKQQPQNNLMQTFGIKPLSL